MKGIQMKKIISLRNGLSLLFLGIVFGATSLAQSKLEVMTNENVIDMVRGGFGETLIVEKIRQSECKFDTGTIALSKLKTAKVSDAIMIAMLEASRGSSDSVSPNTRPANKDYDAVSSKSSSTETERLLRQIEEPGIYLNENGKLLLIEPTVYSGSKSNFLGTALTYGIKKTKLRSVVRGKSANTQIASGRPEFLFVFSREYGNAGAVMSGFGGYAATSPNEFMLISMKIKENSREATLGSFNSYSASTGASDSDVREYKFDKIKPGIYKVVPKTDLAPGEYCFYYAGTAGAGSKVFDFAIR